MFVEPEDYLEPRCPLGRPDHLRPEPRPEPQGRIPLPEIIAECDRLFNANDPVQLGEHLRYWRQRAQELGDESGELSILSELMGHYRMQRDEERALSAVRDGLELMKRLDVYGTAGGGTVLINAATALQSFGYFSEALRYYAEAFRCYNVSLDPMDMRFAGLLNNMAAAYDANGESAHARAYYQKALKILEHHGNRMDMAVTFVNLAQLYDRQDENDCRVTEMLNRAMECFDHPDAVHDGYYAHTCCKCASAFGLFGREDDEDELKRRAAFIYENA